MGLHVHPRAKASADLTQARSQAPTASSASPTSPRFPGLIHAIRIAAWMALGAVLCGCGERDQVRDGYTLVTPRTLGPDHHPGTSLHRNGKTVWANVHVGHFSPHDAASFTRDGMLVFVGPIPGETDWGTSSHLFAVGGDGPPVVLSLRLPGQRRPNLPDSRALGDFDVRRLEPTGAGVRVEFEYWASEETEVVETKDLTWPEIQGWLHEAETSGSTVSHPLGTYRVLPSR